jgi:RsiW-degrading membrane proteinase PrsW (M82 family)
MSAVLVTEETARILEVGLLVFLFVFSRAFGLHWRQSVFGIALGLGVFTSVELAGVALQTHIGPGAYQAFNLARALSFNVSLLIWMGYILAPERMTSTAELPQRAQLEQWNQAIMELIHQ